MTPEETRTLVRRQYEAVNARDLDAFLAGADPDIEIRSLVLRPARGGEAFRGTGGLREWWAAMFGTQDLSLELVRLRVDGDRAVIELILRNDVGGVPAEHTMWHAARFRAGRVLAFGLYPTAEEARAAVDLAPGAGVVLPAEDAG